MTDRDTQATPEYQLKALLWNAEFNLRGNENQLRGLISKVRDDLDMAERYLEETGKTHNSLGIIQGRGSEIDRLCGLIAEQVDQVRVLKRAMEDAGLDPEAKL